MAEPTPRALTDAEIHRSVAETLLHVIVPALREDADWARAAAIQLVGLARYAATRGPDVSEGFAEELADVMATMANNEIVATAWGGDRSPRSVMDGAGRALALAVGRDDEHAVEIRNVLRPVVVRQLDEELATTAPLVEAFRGRLDG
ncbi:MAG: hypothetical protein K0S92_1978 [Desertimonas sp.]|nr:hypothetical protein [Desertimonas sp.]